MKERLLIGAGIALAAMGIALASWPFTHVIDLGGGPTIDAACRAPIIGAWNTESKGQVALWAVTVGTGQQGYEVRSDLGSGVGPYCAGPARQRLAVAVVVTGVGGAATGVGFRRLRRQL